MLLSTTTDILSRSFGEDQAIRMISEAGFDAFDLSLFKMYYEADYAMNRPDYLRYAEQLRKTADEVGIVCNQSHAPFPSSTGDETKDADIYQKIVRSIEIAAVLGAKNIIVHPKQHMNYNANSDAPARLFEINVEFYNALIPYCKQFGIRVAIENMWQHNDATGHIDHSTCSRAEEFVKYLDAIDSEWIVACLDVGHAQLVGGDYFHIIETLGSKRLQALHVHDVVPDRDLHILPYHGSINYGDVTGALAKIGYTGDITFEADSFMKRVPDPIKADALKYMHTVGRHIIQEIRTKA